MMIKWIDSDTLEAEGLKCVTCGCTADDVDAFAVVAGQVLCEFHYDDLEQDAYDAAWLDHDTGIYHYATTA